MNVEIVICNGPRNTCSMCLNRQNMVEWFYLSLFNKRCAPGICLTEPCASLSLLTLRLYCSVEVRLFKQHIKQCQIPREQRTPIFSQVSENSHS